MKYYCLGTNLWFVCSAKNKREARKMALEEFGSGNIQEIRPASDEEIKQYIEEKGENVLDG